MNKTVLSSVGILVLIALFAGGYFLYSRSNSTGKIENSVSNQETSSTSLSQSKSLRDMMAMSTNQECSFNDEGGNSGVVYVGSGKVKGDFTTIANGTSTVSHMYSDGSQMYVWMDGQPTGFKFSLDSMNDISTDSKVSGNVDVNKKLDYSCKNWSVNNSVFVLPTNITFSDFSSLMPSGVMQNQDGNGTNDMKAIQCAACANLTGESKNQCLTALSCN
jgi:hypothetical protein